MFTFVSLPDSFDIQILFSSIPTPTVSFVLPSLRREDGTVLIAEAVKMHRLDLNLAGLSGGCYLTILSLSSYICEMEEMIIPSL